MYSGVVFDIKELTMYDGPGMNVAVFFKGCPLRCQWCHNPEGIEAGCVKSKKGVIGKTYTSESLVNVLKPYTLLQQKLGGLFIFSGGEPLMQYEFIVETLSLLQRKIILDTSGYANTESMIGIIPYLDTVYFDLKLMDDDEHVKYTTKSNSLILKNLMLLEKYDIPVIIRTPVIPGITDKIDNLYQIYQIVSSHSNVLRWELLNYNPFTKTKYKSLDMVFSYQENVSFKINKRYLEENGISCKNVEIFDVGECTFKKFKK